MEDIKQKVQEAHRALYRINTKINKTNTKTNKKKISQPHTSQTAEDQHRENLEGIQGKVTLHRKEQRQQ